MFTLKRSGCVVQVVHLRTFKLCCFVLPRFLVLVNHHTHIRLFIVYLFASPP